MTTPNTLETCFRRLRAVVLSQYPKINVGLLADDEFKWDPRRGFAYCEGTSGGGSVCMIGVNPKLLEARLARMQGVLMHEFGHAVLLFLGHEDHTERDADKTAEQLFKTNIYYDEQDDVQTTSFGVRPRPAYLDDETGCTLPALPRSNGERK